MASKGAATEISPVDRHIGRRLRQRRARLGLEASELDRRIGVPAGTTEKLESGARRADAGELLLLGRALGVEVSYFFTGLAKGRNAARLAARRPATTREVEQFLRAYFGLANADLRRRVFDLVRGIADAGAERRAGRGGSG